MKKIIFALLTGIVALTAASVKAEDVKPKVVLLIAEQNIQGPQTAWWATEVDLSATEAEVAKKLIESGFEVFDAAGLRNILDQDRAFRTINITDPQSIKLGELSKADYVVSGKAVASAGGSVPDSTMRSCFANITAKLINVKDGSVLAYLDAAGSSAHMDVITGGREALVSAAGVLSQKIIAALNKVREGGK